MRKPLIAVLAAVAFVAIATRPQTRAFARKHLGTGRQLTFQLVGRARTAMGLPARSAAA